MGSNFLSIQLWDVLPLLILNALYINGLYYGAEEGKAFHFLHKIGERLPSKLYDTLINCVQCMSTLHGTYFILLFIFYNNYEIIGGVFCNWWDLLLIPCYTLALSFMNLLVNRAYEVLNQAKIKLI